MKIRIGIHDYTLYLYHQCTDPENWLTRLKYEHFYFDTTDIKSLLIKDVKLHLNISTLGLSHITLQITDHKGELSHPKSHLGEYSKEKPYLTGETLNLILNATGRKFEDIQFFITRLGRDTQGDGRGGIHDPIFLEGEKHDLFTSRLIAIALSDGHIHRENKQFTYIEKDAERCLYVKNLMKSIGNVYIAHEERTGADRLTMPVTIGRLLEQYGVPAGDKHLSPNYRLPGRIRDGSNAVKCAYLSEVIPEDGYFDTHGRAKFGIKRAQVLDAGPKAQIYDFQSRIPPPIHNFIKEHGETRKHRIRNEAPREETILVYGKVKELEKSEDVQISKSAKHLREIINQNSCQLLDDEVALIASLGISMHKTPKEIHVQQNGRISIIWEAYTLEESDAIRWAQLAMPSSNPKKRKVEEWLSLQVNSKKSNL